MKMNYYINIITLFLSLICSGGLFSQNNIKLYPYRMNPRNNPDDLRHYVKAPDLSLFENKIQFISLRDLSGNDYKSIIDQWVNKDKLGNILWVSYPLIFQDNIKDVVAEIKKRNLYLFDLWGYVPGSGPGGYWRQFDIPEGVLKLFNTELGERWLGMDNGEQDGRYVGSFAPRMYPVGTDRKHQYYNFQRHFQEMGEQLGNKMATLVSLNFGHYFLKEGVYTLIGAETAQGLPNSQIYYSFIRGAGKQYGVNWFGNASVWNRWGYKTYGKDATNIDDNYDSGGPLKGTSLSLLKRIMYNHIFYNCVAVGFEGSMRMADDRLSPIGIIQQNAAKWVEKHGDPGVMHTPVALMTDFFAGWSFPRHLYSQHAYKVWGNLPYEKSDYLTDGVLDVLYPDYQDASYFRDERGFVTSTPYGDIADCIMSDAPGWVLKQYPVLVIAGGLTVGVEINDKLEAYVREGGHLVITSGSLANLPNGVAGVKVGDKVFSCSDQIAYKGLEINETASYSLAELICPPLVNVIQKSGVIPAMVEVSDGKGKVTVIASPFGVTEMVNCLLPVKVMEEKPLDKPFPLLNHVRAYMKDLFASQELFDTNQNLSIVTCTKGKNQYTVLISNNRWNQQDFVIEAKTGTITSMKELPIDCSEIKAVGYTPKTVTCNVGINTKKTIAGGSVRAFKIQLKNANVEIASEVKTVPNKTGRALVLRDIQNIKEEILSRPTFFEHYDRVVVDWRYLYGKENELLKREAGWINRQKLSVTVDLTSALNLFPDLRIVNNDKSRYDKSMNVMKGMIDKMTILCADELLISTQRTIENNFTIDEFNKSLIESFQILSDYASEKGIHIILRSAVRRAPETLEEMVALVKNVNRSNFCFAPALSLILDDVQNIDKNISILKQIQIKDMLISSPQRDLHNQLWNSNAPLYTFKNKEVVWKLLNAFRGIDYIMDGLYLSFNEEYLDVKELNNIYK